MVSKIDQIFLICEINIAQIFLTNIFIVLIVASKHFKRKKKSFRVLSKILIEKSLI